MEMLRRILLAQRAQRTGGWNSLHSESLLYFYFCSDTIGIIKSRRMTSEERAALAGEKTSASKVFIERHRERCFT
jgi:hypothetical protein